MLVLLFWKNSHQWLSLLLAIMCLLVFRCFFFLSSWFLAIIKNTDWFKSSRVPWHVSKEWTLIMSLWRVCFRVCFFLLLHMIDCFQRETEQTSEQLHAVKVGFTERLNQPWKEPWLLYRGHWSHLIPHMLSNTEQIVHKQMAANGKGSVYFRESACWLRRASSDGATSHQLLNGAFFVQIKDCKERDIWNWHIILHNVPDMVYLVVFLKTNMEWVCSLQGSML